MNTFKLSASGASIVLAFVLLAGCQQTPKAEKTPNNATISSGPEEANNSIASPTPMSVEVEIPVSASTSPEATTTDAESSEATPEASTEAAAVTKTAAVFIQDSAFRASNISVPVGTTVVWTNNEDVAHTVTSDTGVFESKDLAKDSSFSYIFTKEGSFPYHCTKHPTMKGSITVTAE